MVTWLHGTAAMYRGPGKAKQVPLLTAGTTLSSKAIDVDLDITDRTADVDEHGRPRPVEVRVLASAIVSAGESDALIKTAANRLFAKPAAEQEGILIDLLSSSGRHTINLLTHDQLFSARTAPAAAPPPGRRAVGRARRTPTVPDGRGGAPVRVLTLAAVKALAAVFDLDGTLVDNMAYHLEAWAELARSEGRELTAERFARELAGKKTDETLPLLLGRPVTADEAERLAARKEAHYRALYRPHLALVPGAGSLLRALRGRGLRAAIASAAPPENRALVLDGLALGGLFDAVVGGEAAARGKPFPDLFLAAARALGVAPEHCVAFEDAPLGVRAARAAGMRAAAVTTTSPREELLSAGAEWALDDFERLPADLRALLDLA